MKKGWTLPALLLQLGRTALAGNDGYEKKTEDGYTFFVNMNSRATILDWHWE